MEVYCGISFLQSSEASKAQRCKWVAYCGTNWRCTASTFQTSCTGWGFLNSSHTDFRSRKCAINIMGRSLSFTSGYRSLKYYQYSTGGQKFHQNVAPVLVIILWNSLVFSRKIITSTDFYRYCAPTHQHQ